MGEYDKLTGQPDGLVRYIYDNAWVYEGNWSDGQANGFGIMYWQN